jgi:hypothetical protein
MTKISSELVPNSSKICKLLLLKDKTGYEGVWNYSHLVVTWNYNSLIPFYQTYDLHLVCLFTVVVLFIVSILLHTNPIHQFLSLVIKWCHMTEYGFLLMPYRVICKIGCFAPVPLIFPRQFNESIITGETYLVETKGITRSSELKVPNSFRTVIFRLSVCLVRT